MVVDEIVEGEENNNEEDVKLGKLIFSFFVQQRLVWIDGLGSKG